MDWWQAVDIYCERTTAAFWAEPVNALSNASFLAAAFWAVITARGQGTKSPIVWLLIVMAGLIGLGSFLFHTFANRWAEYADTIPIWSFVAVFVLTAMHSIGGMPVRRVMAWSAMIAAIAIVTIFFLASGEGGNAGQIGPDPLNGSGQYVPAVIALLVFSVISRRRAHPGSVWIIGATAVFLVSLTFRTLDRDLCTAIPLGTHFIWHLMNGLMVGLLLQMLIRTGEFERARVR